MSNDGESLKALECLLNEFHSPLSDNNKKKEIEKTLSNFRQTPSAWKLSLFFLSNSQNHYVCMFGLDVLQISICKSFLSKEDKCEIRNTIYSLLMSSLSTPPPSSVHPNLPPSSPSSFPPFLLKKMIQLIVMIAKCDWPHDYPEFFNELTMLLRQERTFLMGLTFVKLASEELMGGREGVAMERKRELNLLFNQHIPILFDILSSVLSSMKNEATKHTNKSCSNNNTTFSNNNTTTCCNNCIPTMCQTILCACLDSLCDLFTWVDLNTTTNKSSTMNNETNIFKNHQTLFSTILELSTAFLLDTTTQTTIQPTTTTTQTSPNKHIHTCDSRCRNDVSLKALSCVCEIFGRNFVNAKSKLEGSFVAEAIQAVLSLLWLLLAEQSQQQLSCGGALSLLDESYLGKLMDFLKLFISKHLRYFEHHPHFHLIHFQSILSAFTFKQPTSELYLQSLELWLNVVDPIVTKAEQLLNNNNNEYDQHINKNRKVLLGVVGEVLVKIQFKTNQSQLELIDDVENLDDLQTEWTTYLFENLDLISKIAKLYPEEILYQVGLLFEEQCGIYFDLEKYVVVEELSQQQLQQQQHFNISTQSSRTTSRQQHNQLKTPTYKNTHLNQPNVTFSQHQQQHQQQHQHQQQDLNNNLNSNLNSNLNNNLNSNLNSNHQPITINPTPKTTPTSTLHHHRTLSITASSDLQRLHNSLRDLMTSLHLYSSILESYPTPNKPPQQLFIMLERLINVMRYSAVTKFYNIRTHMQDTLHTDFVDVFTQSMAVVKVYSSLLSQYRSCLVANGDSSLKEKFDWVVKTTLDCVIPLFLQTEETPEKILMSASQTLYTVLTVVRPCGIYKHHILLQQLYQHKILQPCVNKKVEQMAYRSLVYCLILPWPNETEQEWESRGTLVGSFLAHLLQPYLALTGVGQLQKLASDLNYRQQMKTTVVKHLELMTDIIINLDNAGATSASKKICYLGIESAVNLTLRLLPIYIACAETTCLILTYFQGLVQVHRLNMGAPVVSRIVQDVIELFSKELIMSSLSEEKSSGHQLIDKFLHILLTIASEPGSIFKQFLPDILKIAVNNVYPPVAMKSSPLIKASLFELFHVVLRHNWRYFFPNSLLAVPLGSSHNQSVTTPTCLQDSDEYFMFIMQAIGQSFLQSDLDLFKQNLCCLINLNQLYRLFHKDIFRNNLLREFLRVLLNALLQKSHDLHRDDVTTTIFNMAAVDFEFFFCTFVPSFVEGLEGVGEEEKMVLVSKMKNEQDLPTFSMNLDTFVNDYTYYRLKNQSS